MEFKVFNKQNSGVIKTGEPIVRINTKAGLISFSKDATSLIQITKETKVSFAQDEKNKADWYVFIDPLSGFKVRFNEESLDSCFNCTPLSKEIVNSVCSDYSSVGFKISKTPIIMEDVNYFLLITARPLKAIPVK